MNRSLLSRVLLLMTAIGALGLGLLGCASSTQQQAWDSRATSRAQALAAAVGMPEDSTHAVRDFPWVDASRDRAVPARLYWPNAKRDNATRSNAKTPLLVFSHGIGGSREGYSYIGRYLAANGIAALHLQHVGSDRGLWFGNPLQMVGRLQSAARESEAIARAKDMSFALDTILADSEFGSLIDQNYVAAAGHSYGANTTMLVTGARFEREGQAFSLTDARFKAAIIISAPPFYGQADPSSIVGSIQLPSLHITATGDDIKIPGYFSSAKDRVAVYEAFSSKQPKWLAVFKDGSHSIFTDRLGTGGQETNPKVKIATRELILAFLQKTFDGRTQALAAWPSQYQLLLAKTAGAF